MSRTFAERLKTDGNLNRIADLQKAGCSARDIQRCFQQGDIYLKEHNGDLPLLQNMPELGRKALPKHVVREFLNSGMAPQPT